MLERTEKAIDMSEERVRPILEEQNPLPVQVRNRTQELLEDLEKGTNLRTVTDFLKEIVKAVQKQILGSYGFRYNQCNIYKSDNVENITEEELENILRIVPMALKGYPGVFERPSSTNLKYIPLLLRLRKEFFRDVFGGTYYTNSAYYCNSEGKKDELGGLTALGRGWELSLMKNLLLDNCDQMLDVVRRLKDEGFLRKEHIQNENLIRYVIFQSYKEKPFFEKSFSFLVNWDPEELKRTDCCVNEDWF